MLFNNAIWENQLLIIDKRDLVNKESKLIRKR